MKNIKFHIALLCLIFTIQMMAQSPTVRKFSKTSYILQNAQVMPTNAVADDFGPRNLGQTYWHGGIDFNSAQNDGHADVWDLIISPQAGIIADFDRLTLGADEYKYGLVNINDDEGNRSHTLLFGHVFDWHKQFYDEFGSRIVLKRCEDNNFLKWGLHLNFTDAQGNPVRHTYGQISGATLMVNGTNYTTTNLVNTTDIFIPLGKSGGNPSFRFVPHLHLNTLPFNTNSPGSLPTSPNGDPAQFLNIDRPDYRITAISEGSNEAVGVLMKYPGTNPTKIKARTYMIGEADNTYRYSHLMDMDKVELQIKKSYISDWERIKGDKIEAIISEGGRLGEPMVNHSNPVNKSDWRKTGINSNAYNGATEGPNARNPWDDYYFTDYYSRIHKNDMTGNSDPTLYSDIPSNTRYNDGLYDFRVKTTTSSNGITYSNAQPIYIDNFLPFITDFKFKIGSDPGTSTVFYEIERKQDEGVVDKNDDGYVSNAEHYYKIGLPSPTSKYFIEINTSEPVQQLRYKIKKKDQEFPSNSTIMTQVGNSKMIWRADLSQTLFITQQDELEFEITGNDQANNQLVNVADMTRIIAEFNLPEFQIKIPTRKTNQRTKLAWNNYPSKIGKDRFKVKMSGCQRSASEEICDLIKTVEEEKSLYNCTQVRIDLKNYDNRIELKWYDENGDEILAFANDPTIEVSEPERFCFKLYGEFGDDCCTREGCVFVEASDFEDNSIIITPTIYPGCSNLGPQNGRITLAVDPIGQNYNYSWSHHPNWNFVWAELPTGNHSVTVTTTNGCKKSLLFSIEDIADVVNVYEDNIPSECGQNNGEINLNVTLDEQESSQFFYQWSHGLSGFDYSSVYNLSPGQNCVTISIDGSLNNCSVQRCFEVTERNFDVTATVSPNSNCNLNTPNGSINLSTTGGVEPFTAIWGDNITGMSRENLRTGFYGVTVTDANGCSASNVFVVPGTENITFTGEISMDCITKLYKIRLNNFSLQQNFIMFLYKIENGVKTFKQIFAGYNGAALENLSDGDYEISTTNFSCATGSLQFNIPKPLQITNQQTQENVGCTPDEVNGSITVDFEGGLRPLTVGIGIQSQTVMENSVTFNNINGGLYFLTFEDPNGCLIWTLTGLQYPVMEINGAITHPTGQNSSPPPSNGSILLNVYGGSQDFEYTWTKNNNFYSNEKDLIGLSSGYYKVVVFDPLTGCSNEKRFTLISDICGRELTIGQTLMNCSPGSSGNYSNCSTGCPKDIKILIGSVLNDVANYKLPITVTLSNGLFTGTYTITELTNERGYAFFYNVPVSMTPYYVHAVDECNNSASSELYTCASCSPIMKIYDIISIRDNPGKFDLELYKACEFETGVFKYKSKIRIKNDALAACQDYTITWPDGNETSRVYRNCSSNSTRVKNKWYHLRESDFDGGIKTITIRRNDGCSRTVDFRLGDKKDVVGIRHKNLPSFGRLGVANLPCKDCNTDVIPPVRNLYKESFFCKENSLNDFKKLLKKFHYIPNNNGEPCIGGKLIRHKALPTGIVENHEEIVSPNAFLSTAAWVARDDDEKEYAYFSFGMIDQDNGGCIFSKEYMFPESYLVENMYVNWFRLVKWNLYNSPKTLECGQILKITKIGKIIEIIIDPGSWSHNFIITDENNTILQSHPVSSQGVLIRYHFNTEAYEGQMFKFELKNSGNCPNSVKTLDDSFCPFDFNILPENFNQETEEITLNCDSPIEQSVFLLIGPEEFVNQFIMKNLI
ncbi:MAG: hypothetical protein IPN10_05025 [Saprospiraceae bacterium]|nr:hypothetical protein [Saprospiraceae bacterium]